MGEYMRSGLFFVLSLLMVGGNSYAITCGDTGLDTSEFAVHYACGDGTATSSLPTDDVAVYGMSFTPKYLSTTHCTPPTNYRIAGQEVVVDGEVQATTLTTSATAFTYRYVRDITIQPHYVPLVTRNLAEKNMDINGYSYYSDWGSWVWTMYGYAFWMAGDAICSTHAPENLNAASGFVPNAAQQALLDTDLANKQHSGDYCYCKLKNPSSPISKWVAVGSYNPDVYACWRDCVSRCGSYAYSDVKVRRALLHGWLNQED